LGLIKNSAWFVLVVLTAGCGNRKHDPAPPAASVVIPMGAPRATGAMAAGHAPAPTSVPDPDDTSSEDEDTPPVPPTPPVEVDSGVTL
jgi:hypothetical protein